jgi:hypothetical protein
MTFIVEVSSPFLANDSAYERWELETVSELVERLEEETGWSRSECQEVAGEIAAGLNFRDQDPETGRTVSAGPKTAVAA